MGKAGRSSRDESISDPNSIRAFVMGPSITRKNGENFFSMSASVTTTLSHCRDCFHFFQGPRGRIAIDKRSYMSTQCYGGGMVVRKRQVIDIYGFFRGGSAAKSEIFTVPTGWDAMRCVAIPPTPRMMIHAQAVRGPANKTRAAVVLRRRSAACRRLSSVCLWPVYVPVLLLCGGGGRGLSGHGRPRQLPNTRFPTSGFAPRLRGRGPLYAAQVAVLPPFLHPVASPERSLPVGGEHDLTGLQ